jgi:regulator of sigma E protease
MIDESMDKEQMAQPEQPWEFRSKPSWQRLLIMVGGVLMNFILAFFIYAMVILTWNDSYIPIKKTPLYFSETAQKAGFQDGDIIIAADGKDLERWEDLETIRIIDAENVTILRLGKEMSIHLPENFKYQILGSKTVFADVSPTRIDSIVPGMNAEKSGLRVGDRIIAVNGIPTTANGTFSSVLRNYKDQEVNIEYIRNDQKEKTKAMIDSDGKIGIVTLFRPEIVTEEHNFWSSIPAGINYGFRKISFYVIQLKFIFSKEGASSLGGFGTIASIFPSRWDWFSFWSMTAFLSIILGVMNLLPIPALDGGHVMFLLYEVITRRKPNEKFMEYAQIAGMILLLGLLLYANGNDVIRYFFKK